MKAKHRTALPEVKVLTSNGYICSQLLQASRPSLLTIPHNALILNIPPLCYSSFCFPNSIFYTREMTGQTTYQVLIRLVKSERP